MVNNEGEYDIFIQISFDQNNPEWIRYGILLEKVLSDQINHQEFIDQILDIFEHHKECQLEEHNHNN